MAVLSADNTVIPATVQIGPDGYYSDYPVAASTTIYKHGFVGLNATGYLVQYVAPTGSATQYGNRLVGLSMERVNNGSGSDGDLKCKVQTMGDFSYALSGVAALDVGKPVFVSDDNTLNISGAGNAYIGTIVGYNVSGYCTIRMPGPQMSGLGKLIVAVSPEMDYTVTDQLGLLVHETENHNGLLLLMAGMIVTEQLECTDTAGVITIGHTTGTDTTLGSIFTGVDSTPISDLIIATGGAVFHAAAATGDALIPVPADVAVIAKVTTPSVDGANAGKGVIVAAFAAL